MQGYRLTKRGWVALFSLALAIMLGCFISVSAIIGKINKIADELGKEPTRVTDSEKNNPTPTPSPLSESERITIYFEENTAEIPGGNGPVLDMIIRASAGHPDFLYRLVSCDVEENASLTEEVLVAEKKLVEARIDAIRSYLVKNKVPENRIVIEYLKEKIKNISPTRPDGSKGIRRVEITLLLEKKN